MENTTELVRTTSFPARSGRIVLARIQRNTDLLTGIIDICRKNNFRMAVVETVIGSLRSAEISWTKPSAMTKRGQVLGGAFLPGRQSRTFDDGRSDPRAARRKNELGTR